MNAHKVYLVQTDTTAGFLSQDAKKLASIKQRPASKLFLISVKSLQEQKKYVRTPNKFKNIVRRSKKSSFVYPNGKALRVVKDISHLQFLKKFNFLYSSSANESGKSFNIKFALKMSDIVVEDKRGICESVPSNIYKLSFRRMKKIR